MFGSDGLVAMNDGSGTNKNGPRIGIVLGQIGTPDQPHAAAVKSYLKRFLSDRRVIDYPPWLWQPLLRGVILQVRPRRSAALYKQIWTEEGAPLLVYSKLQQQGLQARLGAEYQVELGLSYTSYDVADAIERLSKAGITRMIILPLFPQYSSTTTASLYEAAATAAIGLPAKRFVPDLRFAGSFHTHPGYIEAMRRNLLAQIEALASKPDYYVLSFHGLPQRYVDTGDPYATQCMETAECLAEAMGWAKDRWQLSFQSRFGSEKWLGPSTADVLHGLASKGVQRPFIYAPGFVTDCLETLHELGIEGREQFQEGGGNPDEYISGACLNHDDGWLDFLADFTRLHASGWSGKD